MFKNLFRRKETISQKAAAAMLDSISEEDWARIHKPTKEEAERRTRENRINRWDILQDWMKSKDNDPKSWHYRCVKDGMITFGYLTDNLELTDAAKEMWAMGKEEYYKKGHPHDSVPMRITHGM